MVNEFWIDVSLQDEEAEKKVMKAIETMQEVHNWTVALLNHRFVRYKNITPYAEFRKDFNKLIRKEKLWRYAQRYSLERAAEKTFPYYSNNIRTNYDADLLPVQPDKINEITIRARKVWKKYLAQGRGITTIYGMIFLEGDWKKILREQAGDIPIDLFPYLWHSVTLRQEDMSWKLKFNHHAENSIYGDKARDELERDYADAD
jgi:hypothetical protein